MDGIHVCIFDFDGTLCDTRSAVVACLQQTLDQAGKKNVDQAVMRESIARGATLHDTFRALLPDASNDAANALVLAYRAIYTESGHLHAGLYPGVKATLQWLEVCNIQRVIVSNKGYVAIHKALLQHHLQDKFDLVLADSGLTPNKPNPNSFQQQIRPRFPHVDLDGFLMIGDTETDIEYARRCGIDACWVRYGYGRPLLGISARYTLGMLNELSDIVSDRMPTPP